MKRSRLLLIGRYQSIEPLGIICLMSLAEDLGWETRVCLVKGSDFEPVFEEIVSFCPDIVGFSVLTGHHLKAFVACDRVRKFGLPVIIGGSHATYFSASCLSHADYVVIGDGFRIFRKILQGELSPGVHFDSERLAEGFPFPKRQTLYRLYPEFGQSPIKSIICSVGCPHTCGYCYNSAWNALYGGFKLKLRSIDDVIEEALAIKEFWPPEMIYFQDDNFGLDLGWLEEFAGRWQTEIGLPWHCQIRLELAQNINRLKLFRQAGCTGVTVAIESGNEFLREYVLHRRMSDKTILGGVRNIKDQGLTLRTEQILAVPFSNLEMDLETLELNCRLAPEMAWTSIMVPYGGTEMGSIVANLGLYIGNNDDLKESFFSRSVLRHCSVGREVIEPIVKSLGWKHGNPLLQLRAVENSEGQSAHLVLCGDESKKVLGEIQYLSEVDNRRLTDQTVILQQLFGWLSHLPDGHKLGATIVDTPKDELSWKKLGQLTRDHLDNVVGQTIVDRWISLLYQKMSQRPLFVRENPLYFVFFPGGEDLVSEIVSRKFFTDEKIGDFEDLGTVTRHHSFETSLYRIRVASEQIAKCP